MKILIPTLIGIIVLLAGVTYVSASSKGQEEKSSEYLVGVDLLSLYQTVNSYHTDIKNVPKLGERNKTNDTLIKSIEELDMKTNEGEKIKKELIKKLQNGKVDAGLTYIETYAKRFLNSTDLQDVFLESFDKVASSFFKDSSSSSSSNKSYATYESSSSSGSWLSGIVDSIKGFFSNLGFK